MHLISILLLKFFRSYVELDLTLEKKGLSNFFFSILLNDFVFFRLTSSNIYIYTHIHVCVHVCTCKLEINFVPPKIKSCSNIEHLHHIWNTGSYKQAEFPLPSILISNDLSFFYWRQFQASYYTLPFDQWSQLLAQRNCPEISNVVTYDKIFLFQMMKKKKKCTINSALAQREKYSSVNALN